MTHFQPTHFNNGDLIPVAKSIEEFNVTFCDVKTPYRIELNGTTYYNKYAVQDSRGIMPAGYRFPEIQDAFDIQRRSYIMETSLNSGFLMGGCWIKENVMSGTFKNILRSLALIFDSRGTAIREVPLNWGFELYFIKL